MKDQYILFLDKPNKFECKIALEGASLKNAVARLVLEQTGTPSLVFNGTISDNKCEIPISSLKQFFKENDTGNIKLEVIAEDVYFQPWTSQYSIKLDKKLTVEIATPISDKKILKVEIASPESVERDKIIESVVQKSKMNGINAKNLLAIQKRGSFTSFLKEALGKAQYSHNRTQLMENIISKL